MPDNRIDVDTLPPKDAAYLDRIERALRCGVPGCDCASGPRVHCPCHDNPLVPTLAISYDEDTGFSFACTRCPVHRVMEALAEPRPNDGAKTRAAQAFLTRALTGGPRPAAAVEREVALLGISKATLVRVRTLCNVKAFRVSTPGVPSGAGAWHWSFPSGDTSQQDETE